MPEMMEQPMGEGQDGGTFFLHKDYPGCENLKTGDRITLEVVGNQDGEVEVKPMMGESEGEEKDWKTDLRESLSAPPEGGYEME